MLGTHSLGNSACAESGHRQTFKHQTCRLGWFNEIRHWHLEAERVRYQWHAEIIFIHHTNPLLCRLSICHFVNGSLVISQPSSMVPTKVVPHASPAISITDMIWVSTKQSVWTLRNRGRYSRIFTSVRNKIYKQPCTKNQKKYVIRDGFWQTCTNWKPQSNDISISSAIWQVLLVSDSLRDSACVRGAHRHKFKHQMCCPGWFNWMRLWTLGNREHLMDEICHTNCLLQAQDLSSGQWLTCHLPAFSSCSNKGGASCKSCNFEHWPARQKQC